MAILRAQYVFPHESGVPAQAVTNTWYFRTPTDDPVEVLAAAAAAQDDLHDFYYLDPTNGIAVLEYFANDYPTLAAYSKWYNLADAEPRAPIFVSSAGPTEISRQSATDLPSEVAVCLSFARAVTSGQNRARARGRVYIGPLNVGAQSAAGATESTGVRPSTSMRTSLSQAAERLRVSTDSEWVQYSTLANDAGTVTHGYIDNAWDVQRRRGIPSNARTVWGI